MKKQFSCFVCRRPATQKCIGQHCNKYVCDEHLTEICMDCSSREEPKTEELRNHSHNRQQKKSPFWIRN